MNKFFVAPIRHKNCEVLPIHVQLPKKLISYAIFAQECCIFAIGASKNSCTQIIHLLGFRKNFKIYTKFRELIT
jgi:hypothetical protein